MSYSRLEEEEYVFNAASSRSFARTAAVLSEAPLNSLDAFTDEEQMLRESGERAQSH